MNVLQTIPRTRWFEASPQGNSLLHYACWGDNAAAAAALIEHGVNPNAPNAIGILPVHDAVTFAQPNVLRVLCAGGAYAATTASVMHRALESKRRPKTDDHERNAPYCAFLLLSGGARIPHDLDPSLEGTIDTWMRDLDRGVGRTRTVIVALLGLHRHRRAFPSALDRWAAREIGFAVWQTRLDHCWQVLEDVPASPHNDRPKCTLQ